MDVSRSDRPPLVGLTTYGRNEQGRYDLPGEYLDSVRRAGGAPVLLAPGEKHWRTVIERLDALVLTGGGDIAPHRYGGAQHDTLYNVNTERDTSEVVLGEYVMSHELPTLAICRGMQIVNVAMGGTLHPHLPEVYGDRVAHRVPPRNPTSHRVDVVPDSRLAAQLGACASICPSWHHQSIDRIAAGFEAVAFAPDGCVEAMESPAVPWLIAVQWHPELSAADDPVQQRLFERLVKMSLTSRVGQDTP